jgi:hypothetical protein
MIRPSKTEIKNQTSESSAKMITEQITQRESYIVSESTFALKLIRFMKCRIITDISKITDTDLLKAVKQTSETITN